MVVVRFKMHKGYMLCPLCVSTYTENGSCCVLDSINDLWTTDGSHLFFDKRYAFFLVYLIQQPIDCPCNSLIAHISFCK